MKGITEANFDLKGVKILNSGVKAKFTIAESLAKDYNTKNKGEFENNDAPHPDLIKAMDLLLPVVAYDEGNGDVSVITIKGIAFKSDSVVKITHMKELESGATSRSSGWISFDDEEFELADELKKACLKIKHETYQYFIKNKRTQLTLPIEEAA